MGHVCYENYSASAPPSRDSLCSAVIAATKTTTAEAASCPKARSEHRSATIAKRRRNHADRQTRTLSGLESGEAAPVVPIRAGQRWIRFQADRTSDPSSTSSFGRKRSVRM